MKTNRIVDLHSHILFGIDDGAENLEESISMAKQWTHQNVSTVVASPHFDIKKDNREKFLKIRQKNMVILKEELKKQSIDLNVLSGAELYFRTNMVYEDLSPFVIEGTDYLLIELSTTRIVPNMAFTFQELIIQGYKPILVHIERYPIFRNDLDLLHELSEMGVIFQVNAEKMIQDKSSWLKAAINNHYVHILASDAHNQNNRSPNLQEALKQSKHKDYYNENAQKIITNQKLNLKRSQKLYKVFGKFL